MTPSPSKSPHSEVEGRRYVSLGRSAPNTRFKLRSLSRARTSPASCAAALPRAIEHFAHGVVARALPANTSPTARPRANVRAVRRAPQVAWDGAEAMIGGYPPALLASRRSATGDPPRRDEFKRSGRSLPP